MSKKYIAECAAIDDVAIAIGALHKLRLDIDDYEVDSILQQAFDDLGKLLNHRLSVRIAQQKEFDGL